MARTLSSTIQSAINGESVRICHLLNIQTSTPIYVTNWSRDITYQSNTYSAGGTFVELTEVEESGDLQYQDLAVKLQNVTTSVRDDFKDEDFINVAAKIYIVFLNSNENILDVYEYFNGSVAYASLFEQKKQFGLNLQLANQWRNWEIIKGRKYTSVSQQKHYPNDLGLSFAHETNENVRWNR